MIDDSGEFYASLFYFPVSRFPSHTCLVFCIMEMNINFFIQSLVCRRKTYKNCLYISAEFLVLSTFDVCCGWDSNSRPSVCRSNALFDCTGATAAVKMHKINRNIYSNLYKAHDM